MSNSMVSERQIAANRANGKRGTGPKTITLPEERRKK
jgi:hypothetical protein